MKRILTFVLALLILAGMGAAVFAASGADGSGGSDRLWGKNHPSTEISVLGEYVPATEETKVYRVTIDWPDLKYEYTVDGAFVWNTEDHVYVDHAPATLKEGTARTRYITVANFSNDRVKITAEYKPSEAEKTAGIKGQITGLGTETDKSVTLDRCEVGESTGVTQTFSFGLSGQLSAEMKMKGADALVLGTLTVTVGAVGG